MIPPLRFPQLRNVEFPIYPIPKGDLFYRDGLLLINGKVLDDKNMPGATLGLRRLQTTHKLVKLRKSIPDICTMISSGYLNFIDSKGYMFRYMKERYLPVHYKRIKKIEKRDTYSLMWVTGVSAPFVLKRPPQEGEEWAGVIYLAGYPWEIYELCRLPKSPSKKKF